MICIMDLELENYVVKLLNWTEETADSLNGLHKKWAVALLGPIASGKGTQADFLAKRFGLVHVENSKIIEEKFANAKPDDKEVIRIKEEYLSGHWIDPEVMVKWLLGKLEEVAENRQGIVLSSAFRTQYEAEKEIEFFEKTYGKENIKIISLNLSEKESIERSISRRICKADRHPIPNLPEFKNLDRCPQDGSELITRVLDKPELVKVRYQEHLTRTKPVLNFLKEKGYKIIEINGEQSIEDVFQDALKGLEE